MVSDPLRCNKNKTKKKNGAVPKLTMSAIESNSFPISELTLSSLAIMPSKKSKIAATKINKTASINWNWKLIKIAPQPQMRLQTVKKFGMCCLNDMED